MTVDLSNYGYAALNEQRRAMEQARRHQEELLRRRPTTSDPNIIDAEFEVIETGQIQIDHRKG